MAPPGPRHSNSGLPGRAGISVEATWTMAGSLLEIGGAESVREQLKGLPPAETNAPPGWPLEERLATSHGELLRLRRILRQHGIQT